MDKHSHRIVVLTLAGLAFSVMLGAGQNDTRAIIPEEFLKARPPSKESAKPRDTYRPATPAPRRPTSALTAELGVTMWRLRAAVPGDAARLLVHEPAAGSTELTPERIEVGTLFSAGDRVRISIESSRPGYLYVVDRERYADGTFSDPFLIFPTSRTRGGDNRVVPGRLVDIPAQSDNPPYFTIRPGTGNQVAEVLSLVVLAKPVNLPQADAGSRLSPDLFATWMGNGSASLVERLEMTRGSGRAWSAAEQAAAGERGRLLTQADHGPQTIFRVATPNSGFLAAELTLGYSPR